MYLMNKEKYDKVVKGSVTKDYMKLIENLVEISNYKKAKIAKKFKLEDRMTKHTTNECYFLYKDHKKEVAQLPEGAVAAVRLPCHLIKPGKSDIQKISKDILDEINSKIRSSTKLNQWRNTHTVLK